MLGGYDYDIRTILAIVGIGWYSLFIAIGTLGCVTARRKYRHRSRSPYSSSSSTANAPGVSILRPLKGLDTNLFENLESAFVQDYPNFELILSVADAHDQALPVVRELMAKYPGTNARIIIGEEVVGVNPKVNNLVRPYREAAHDILWVLDSNISVIPQTLGRSVDSLVNAPSNSSATKRRISLVHHVPYASYDEWSLGAAVESAFLNTNHAKMYVAINEVALESCVVGKSCLYRRSDIERLDGSLRPISSTSATSNSNSNLNSASSRPRSSSSSSLLTTSPTRGLPAFARFLAEDNMLASALWHELDTRHALGADVAHNAVGRMRLRDYVWRRVRWLRVRKRMTPIAATLAEPFTESVVLGMMVCASLWRLVGVNPVWVIVAHYMWWIAVDLDVYASLAGHPLPSASRVEFFAAWTIREALALPIWVLAMMGNTVEWRGTKYRILRNGEVAKAGKEKDSRERDGVVYERLSDA